MQLGAIASAIGAKPMLRVFNEKSNTKVRAYKITKKTDTQKLSKYIATVTNTEVSKNAFKVGKMLIRIRNSYFTTNEEKAIICVKSAKYQQVETLASQYNLRIVGYPKVDGEITVVRQPQSKRKEAPLVFAEKKNLEGVNSPKITDYERTTCHDLTITLCLLIGQLLR